MSASQTPWTPMNSSSQPIPLQLPLIPYCSEPPSNRFSHSYRIPQGASNTTASPSTALPDAPRRVLPDANGFYHHIASSMISAPEKRVGRGRVMDPNFLMPPAQVFGWREPDLYALGHKVNPTHYTQPAEETRRKEKVKPKSQSENHKPAKSKSGSKSEFTVEPRSSGQASTKLSSKSSSKKSSDYGSVSSRREPRDLRYLYDWSKYPSGPPPPLYSNYTSTISVDRIPYRTERPEPRMSRSYRIEEPLQRDLEPKKARLMEKDGAIRVPSVQNPNTFKIAPKIAGGTANVPDSLKKKIYSQSANSLNDTIQPRPSNLPPPLTKTPSTSSSQTAVDPSAADPLPKLSKADVAPVLAPSFIERGRTLERAVRRSRSVPMQSLKILEAERDPSRHVVRVDGQQGLPIQRMLGLRKPRPRPLDLRSAFYGLQSQPIAKSQDTAKPFPTASTTSTTAQPIVALGPLSVHFDESPPQVISLYINGSRSDCGSDIDISSDSDGALSDLDDAHDAGSTQDLDAVVARGLPRRTSHGDTPHPAKVRFSFSSASGSQIASVQGIGSVLSTRDSVGVSGRSAASEAKHEHGASASGGSARSASLPRQVSEMSGATVSESGREGGLVYTIVSAGPNGELPFGCEGLNLVVRRWLERENVHSHFVFARSCEMKYDIAARQIYYEAAIDDIIFGSAGETRMERFYPMRREVEWRRYH